MFHVKHPNDFNALFQQNRRRYRAPDGILTASNRHRNRLREPEQAAPGAPVEA
jgi:hypothetical protein